jgi:ATP-binding protein involved in chromosome partitioning
MSLNMYKEKEPLLTSVKYTIAIAAGKGGVGKSTVTVNTALALKHLGYSVGIMDTDIYGPSVRRMLPEDLMPTQKEGIIHPALCQGIKMISIAYFRHENEAAAVRAPIANGLVTQFVKNVNWGKLDYLLIDFPPGTGDVQLTLSQQANLTGAIMVTTPQEVALMDVRKAMHLFEQVHVPIIGVVENMSYFHHKTSGEILHLFGKGGGERLASERGVPFLGMIPLDPELCRVGDLGISLFQQTEQLQPTQEAFIVLAKHLVSQVHTLTNESQGCLSQFDLEWKEMDVAH